MSKNYTLGQRYIVYMLLVSLLLQSCNNSFNPLIPLEEAQEQPSPKGQSEDTQELAEQVYIGEEKKELTAQEDHPENVQEMIIGAKPNIIDNSGNELLTTPLDWKSREGHVIYALYQAEGSMRATVYDQASSQLVYDLPVYIFPGCSLAQIATYPKKKLAQHLYIKLSSKHSQGAVIVSPGGLNGGGNVGGKEGKKPKQKAIAIRSTLGQLDRVPVDVLKIIFSYAGSKGMSQVRQLSRAFYKRTTGYKKPEFGVKYKPEASMLTEALSLHTRALNFKSMKEALTPESIPSFPFYRLIGKVQHIPPSFWPYLAGTHVETLDLAWDQIGDARACELAKHLLGTNVHTLNLQSNEIGDAGAIGLAQHLPGTQVQTLYLQSNEIGAAGAVELAKHLKGTQVQTLYLKYNRIGAETQQTLKEQYPHIRWEF